MNKLRVNGFIVPNALIDQYNEDLDPYELNLILIVIRKTIGWHKESDGISLSQFKKLCNIKSLSTIADKLKSLEKKGFIQITPSKRLNGGDSYNLYSLGKNFHENDTPPLPGDGKAPYREMVRPLPGDGKAPYREMVTQNTLEQNTLDKEREKKNFSETEKPDAVKRSIRSFSLLEEIKIKFPARDGASKAKWSKKASSYLNQLSDKELEQLLAAIEQYKKSGEVKDGATMHPETFLSPEESNWRSWIPKITVVKKPEQRIQEQQKAEQEKAIEQAERREAERLEAKYQSLPKETQIQLHEEALRQTLSNEFVRDVYMKAKKAGENPLERPAIRGIYLDCRNQMLANWI